MPTPTVRAIRSSVDWASAARRICARLILRTGPVPAARERLQLVPFFCRQRDAIAYVHGHLGSHSRSRVQPSVPRFTAKQGQYLAFIHTYTLLHREPPAEADFQRFFQVTPPAVHDMIIALERRGPDQPGPATTPDDRLLLSADELPALQPIKITAARY